MKSLQAIKVLLIEDNPSDVLLLRSALEADPTSTFSLTHVERLDDGLKQLKGEVFDIILADLGLPDSLGLETFKRLHEQAPDLPMIVFSGNDNEEQALQAVREGAQDYLVKSLSGFEMAARSIRYAIERSKLQRSVKDSEQWFNSLFRSNPVPVGITRQSDYRIVDVNDAWEKLTGYTREEAIGHTTIELGLAKATTLQQIRTLLRDDGVIQQLEITLYTRHGEERQVSISSQPIHMEGEGYYLNSLLDITERKQAEEKLRDSEEFLRLAYEAADLGIWKNDLQTGTVEFDERARIHYGIETKVTTIDEVLKRVHPDDVGRLGPEIAAATAPTGNGKFATEYRVIHPDGSIHWLAISVRVTFDGEGDKRRPLIGYGTSLDISEHKHAELALQEKIKLQEQLEKTASVAPGVLCSFRQDANGNNSMPYASPAFREIYGMEPAEVATDMSPAFARFDPQDIPHVQATIAESAASMKPWRDEFRYHHPQKGLRWFAGHSSPVREDDGSILWHGIIEDITERKQIEEELRESEKKYGDLINGMNDTIWVLDFDVSILDVNLAASSQLGYTREELLSMKISDIDQNLTTENIQNLAASIQQDERQIFETWHTAKDGRKIPLEISSSLVSYRGKNAILSIARDVTERKKAETAIRESEERLRKTIQTTSDGFWIVDSDGKFLDVNEAYCTMSGYGREELLSMSIPDVEALETRNDTTVHIQHILQTGNDSFESRHRRKDGTQFDVEVSVNMIGTDSNLMVCFCRDITERKNAERETLYRQELLEKVIQLGKNIASLTDLDQCLREIYNSARFGLGFDRVGLFLYDVTLRHVLGIYGTTRTGEIEEPGFYDGPVDEYSHSWEIALQSPSGISWIENYQEQINPPQNSTMYGVGQHITVAAWAGEKPVALISADNLLTGKRISPAEVEALQLFAGYVGLAIDNASLHTELELKVEERTAEVKDLYDNSPSGYHSLDVNGCFIQVNQTELKWLGRTQAEMIGHHISEFITEQSKLIFQENFPSFKAGGALINLELEMIRKDGSTFPVLINATAIRDGQGNYLMSRTTVIDHTERRKAEKALRESQSNMQYFFDTASDLIQSMDESGNYIYVNSAWCEILGYSSEEASQLNMLEVVDPAYHEHCRAMLTSLMIDQHPQQLEIVFRTKQGQEVIVEGSVSSRMEVSGHIITNGIFRNITERKRAEESLQRANAELERALRMKDEFLASMSHELRTPLTGILGLSEALQYNTYGELSAKQNDIVANIESNGRHLLELINDILDVSKIEAGKFELNLAPCVLGDICQASLQLVKGMAHKKNQNIAFSINPADIILQADPRRLKQILVNLISNAVKYSPENSQIGLNVQADADAQIVTIEVWDKGMGISNEDLERLFQPFVQLDSSLSRQQSGTGLGLALVKRLVDLHGGSIQVTSTPGQGSQFKVTLPYSPNTLEMLENIKDLPSIKRSLIVEDQPIDADRLTRFLKSLGIHSTVLPAGNGVLEKAAALQPGVILLDLNLPDTSGWEILKALKENEKTRHIPVIITSVQDEPDKARKFGADGYLLKLFTLNELKQALVALPQPEATNPEEALVVSAEVHIATIMIVDDNETNILVLEDFLHAKNYKVHSYRNGIDFLAHVDKVIPDLVLMDIQMPGMDGLEATRRLRLHPRPEIASVPVIAITALAMPGDRERCLEAGANEYVSKPIRLNELTSMIQNMVLK